MLASLIKIRRWCRFEYCSNSSNNCNFSVSIIVYVQIYSINVTHKVQYQCWKSFKKWGTIFPIFELIYWKNMNILPGLKKFSMWSPFILIWFQIDWNIHEKLTVAVTYDRQSQNKREVGYNEKWSRECFIESISTIDLNCIAWMRDI